MDKIYIITVFEKIEDGDFAPELGSRNTVGWYNSFSEAENVVINNMWDIWETCYNYAVIEEINQGLYKSDRNSKIYQYNIELDKYERIEKPQLLKHLCGYWN